MSENSFNIESFCCICGNNQTEIDCSETRITEEKIKLTEAFIFLTCLKISEEEEYSNLMCWDCLYRLKDAYILKKQALKTYEKFQEYKNREKEQSDNDDEDVQPSNWQNEREEIKNEILEIEEEIVTEEDEDEDTLSEKHLIDSSTNAVEFLSNESKVTSAANLLPRKQRNRFSMKDKKHECQVCRKKFLRKSNLVDHLRLHANMKLFKCEYCEKSFVQSGNYKSHLRIHTNERPYICPICSRSYNQSSALKVHIRIHTNERNYICNVCSKGFTNSSDLTKHARVHDPSKQFKCDFCDRTFAQKVNLKIHKNNTHRNEVDNVQND